jgi:glycogen debranching enzyme
MARYDLPRIRERQRFLVKDAGFNAIYASDLAAMEQLARLIGDDAGHFARRRKRVVDGMLKLMYDDERHAFFDVQEPGARRIGIATPSIFFPLMAEEVPASIAQAVVDAHFDRAGEFGVPYPLPSVDQRDPSFCRAETPFLWRGPTWAVNNWFVYHALKKRGMVRQAEALRTSLWGLVERSGFREYYDPFTGQGHGALDFTWSGLLVDMV